MKKHKHIWTEYNCWSGKFIDEDGLDDYSNLKINGHSVGQLSGSPYSLKCKVCGIFYTQTRECKLRETTWLEYEIPKRIENKLKRIINREVKLYYKKLRFIS